MIDSDAAMHRGVQVPQATAERRRADAARGTSRAEMPPSSSRLLAPATMGFAIQRGATCTVAAVDEVVRETLRAASPRCSRRRSGSAAAAVAPGAAGLPKMPAGYAVGVDVARRRAARLGALVNAPACSARIARFGSASGPTSSTPLGFYVGCVSVGRLFPRRTRGRSPGAGALLQMRHRGARVRGDAAWRLVRARPRHGVGDARWTGRRRSSAPASGRRTPRPSSSASRSSSCCCSSAPGPTPSCWPSSRSGMAGSVGRPQPAVAALLGGAVSAAGPPAVSAAPASPVAQVLRCFVGGVLMGWGSVAHPGGNDGLILVGLPLLRPYAWLAFGTMCVSIGAAIGCNALAGPCRGSRAAHGG
jgi:toxin CptA